MSDEIKRQNAKSECMICGGEIEFLETDAGANWHHTTDTDHEAVFPSDQLKDLSMLYADLMGAHFGDLAELIVDRHELRHWAKTAETMYRLGYRKWERKTDGE